MALAARATTLKDLVASLKDKAEDVAKAAPQPTTPAGAPALSSAAIKTALANTARTEPAVPFPSAHGYLTLPAGGVNVVDFGGSDGFAHIIYRIKAGPALRLIYEQYALHGAYCTKRTYLPKLPGMNGGGT